MLDAASLGQLAESLASKLSSGVYRFVLLFVIVLGAVVSYLNTSNLTLSLLFVSLAPLLLLFSLLTPENVPAGWNPFYTFVLLLSFVLVTIILIGAAVYLSSRADLDTSQDYFNNWGTQYEISSQKYNAEAESVARTSGSRKYFSDLSRRVDECEELSACSDFREYIIGAATFLNDWEKCRAERCRLSTTVVYFDGKIYDFWANFRCYIANLRSIGGYGRDFGALVQARYEELPRVVARLEASGHPEGIGNSLRVCSKGT